MTPASALLYSCVGVLQLYCVLHALRRVVRALRPLLLYCCTDALLFCRRCRTAALRRRTAGRACPPTWATTAWSSPRATSSRPSTGALAATAPPTTRAPQGGARPWPAAAASCTWPWKRPRQVSQLLGTLIGRGVGWGDSCT